MKKPIVLLTLIITVVSQNLFAVDPSYENSITAGMTCVIVQHEVSDFTKWKAAYAADETRRKKAGINEMLVLQGDQNSTFITVVFGLSDVEKAKDFFNDPKTGKLMGAAGVSSSPSFTYFNVANSHITNGSAYMIISHKVENYDRWKQSFEQHRSERSKYQVSVTAVGSTLDDPLHVLSILNSSETANFEKFLLHSDLKEAMQNAGIASEPVSFLLKQTK